ncbi:MAG: VanW family protein [Clostridia bacterium]|nr:VanW family protein [Clostridia bacterium]
MNKGYITKTRFAFVACFLFCVLALGFAAVTATASQATACAAAWGEEDRRAEITVHILGKEYVYRDELLPAPDYTVYEELTRRNINAPLADKIKTVDKCLSAGAQWREAIRYAFPLLPQFVERIKTENDLAPKNSEMVFSPDSRPMFRISRHRDGIWVDDKRLYQDIYLALRKDAKADIVVKPQSVAPEVTVEDNIKRTQKISAFSTNFSTSGEGRKNNIRLALKKINGTVLQGGEEFSFNGKVGPRTERNGFTVAKIIVAGEYTDGVGGGVCQVSTTLYNAALTAGMRVTDVHNHSILPSYVPPSLDSMVNSASSDLRFVNPYETPVFIKAETIGDTARVTFYGTEPPYKIKTVSREISRTAVPTDKEMIDTEHKYVAADTPAGTRVRVSYGHSGVKSEGYLRYFTRDGALVREEKIRNDVYGQTQGIVAVAP